MGGGADTGFDNNSFISVLNFSCDAKKEGLRL